MEVKKRAILTAILSISVVLALPLASAAKNTVLSADTNGTVSYSYKGLLHNGTKVPFGTRPGLKFNITVTDTSAKENWIGNITIETHGVEVPDAKSQAYIVNASGYEFPANNSSSGDGLANVVEYDFNYSNASNGNPIARISASGSTELMVKYIGAKTYAAQNKSDTSGPRQYTEFNVTGTANQTLSITNAEFLVAPTNLGNHPKTYLNGSTSGFSSSRLNKTYMNVTVSTLTGGNNTLKIKYNVPQIDSSKETTGPEEEVGAVVKKKTIGDMMKDFMNDLRNAMLSLFGL